MLEITVRSVVLGIVLAVLLGAANAYLGLKVGMTVSASIPAAVVSMAVLRLMRRPNLLENNQVQTAVPAGESLAAGVLFTMPALVLMGVWQSFSARAPTRWRSSSKVRRRHGPASRGWSLSSGHSMSAAAGDPLNSDHWTLNRVQMNRVQRVNTDHSSILCESCEVIGTGTKARHEGGSRRSAIGRPWRPSRHLPLRAVPSCLLQSKSAYSPSVT